MSVSDTLRGRQPSLSTRPAPELTRSAQPEPIKRWLPIDSGPCMNGRARWAEHGRECSEVVRIAGEDVVAES